MRADRSEAPRPLPADAGRPPVAPRPDGPLTAWNPIEAGYRDQLLRHLAAAYGPAQDADAVRFFVAERGPLVVLFAHLTQPRPGLLVGTAARPGPMAFDLVHAATDRGDLHLWSRAYAAELVAVYRLRPPTPQEPLTPPDP